jgi:hypothetical protein
MQSEPVDNPEVNEQQPQVPILAAEAPVDNSAAEDAVLDRLLGIDSPAPRQETPAPEPSAPANDPDFDRALKALQRDGVPADVIDAIKSDPSKVKDWGLKAAKRQADVDAFGAKMAESKKTEAKPTDERKAEPKDSVKTDDGEADADPLSEFGEIFGDEAVKPLKAMTERLRSEFDAKQRALEVRYETKDAYQRISSQYGQDAPSFDEITEVAARVGRENPGKFNSVSEVVEEAFRLRAGPPKKADPRNIARPNPGKTPPRPVRQLDREDVVLDVLLSGGTRADALRAITR